MNTTLDIITRLRVVPALVIDDAKLAAPLGHAMSAGGLPIAEVTLRTPAALESLRAMAQVSGLCVGAGTVTTVAQAGEAIDAGATFVVTPGLDEDLVRFCQQRGVPIIPGAVTPTEIMRAQNLGLGLVKFFPCNAFGGLPAIQALSGPFPEMKFLPTGGINLENIATYLAQSAVLACGGTWMVKREWITAGRLGMIEDACRQTSEFIRH